MLIDSKNFTIIGDPHLRFRKGGSLDYQGQQPLDISINNLESAFLSAGLDNRPVYIAGDLFDKAQFNYAEIKEIIFLCNQYKDIQIFIIRGNHDTPLVHKWGVPYPTNHVLYVLSHACENVEIVHTEAEDYYHHIYENGNDLFLLFFLPYMESDTSFKQALKDILFMANEVQDIENKKTVYPLLICHQSIDPLVPNVSVTLEDFKGFYWVWNGHIHTRALLGNPSVEGEPIVRILGSLTYQTRSDDIIGSPDKGYYIIDLEAEGKPFEEHYVTVDCPKIEERFIGQPPVEGAYMFWINPEETVEREEKVLGEIVDDASKDGRVRLAVDYIKGLNLDNPQIQPLLTYLIGKEVGGAFFEEVVNNEFLTIRIEGFLSYAGEAEYDLSYEGKTYIHGLEGSGKSNILKALVWVLTGTYWNKRKKFTKPVSYSNYASQVKGFSGCKVELDFTRNGQPYTIVRTSGKYKGDVYGENLPEGMLLIGYDQSHPYVENFDQLLTGPAYDEIPQTARRNNQKFLDYIGLSVNDIIYTIAIRPEFSDLISADQKEARIIFDSMVGADWIDKVRKHAEREHLKTVNGRVQAEDKVELRNEAVEAAVRALNQARHLHKVKVDNYATDVQGAATDAEQATKSRKQKEEALNQASEAVKILLEQAPTYNDNDALGITGERATRQAELSGLNMIIQLHEEAVENLKASQKELIALQKTKGDTEGKLGKERKKLKQLTTRRDKALTTLQGLRLLETIVQDIDEQENIQTKAGEDIARLTGLIGVHKQVIEEKETELAQTRTGANCPKCSQPLPENQLQKLIEDQETQLGEKRKNQAQRKKHLEKANKDKQDATELLAELRTEEQQRDEADNLLSDLNLELLVSQKAVTDAEEYLSAYEGLEDTAIAKVEGLEAKVNDPNYDGGKTRTLIEEKEGQIQKLTQRLEGLEKIKEDRRVYLETVVQPVRDQEQTAIEALEQAKIAETAANTTVTVLLDQQPGKDPDNWKQLQDGETEARTNLQLAEELLAVEVQKEEALTLIKTKVLNPKGLKPFVIGKKLTAINYYCLQYSKIVQNTLQIKVDGKGNYIFDVDFNGERRDGVSLSTGWTFHANMTLLGALIKERERRTTVNVMFIDEPFATIPEESIYKVATMVDAVGAGKSVHIITHSQSLDVTLARSVRIAGGIEEGQEVPSRIEI